MAEYRGREPKSGGNGQVSMKKLRRVTNRAEAPEKELRATCVRCCRTRVRHHWAGLR